MQIGLVDVSQHHTALLSGSVAIPKIIPVERLHQLSWYVQGWWNTHWIKFRNTQLCDYMSATATIIIFQFWPIETKLFFECIIYIQLLWLKYFIWWNIIHSCNMGAIDGNRGRFWLVLDNLELALTDLENVWRSYLYPQIWVVLSSLEVLNASDMRYRANRRCQ
jgi:hypothetical protein